MKFDRSKILTVVTADQAKVGQKGWFASNIETLARLVREEQPKELLGVNAYNAVHVFKTVFQNHALFYPAPEPTYAERQAEWVKEHNIQVGTKVRITRAFSEGEDGIAQSWNASMGTTVGKVGVVKRLSSFQTEEGHTKGIRVDFGDCQWWYPYFTLEVIKEPTYRPYNNDEMNDLVGKVLIQKNTGNAMMAIRSVDGEVGKLISLGGSQKRNAHQLLNGWTHKNGEPCGVREES